MTLSLSTGAYEPRSPKGTETIKVCGLNRGQLVDGRRRARKTVADCLRCLSAELHEGQDAAAKATAENIRLQPFADVCQAMLRQALAPGAEDISSATDVPGRTPAVLGYLRMAEVRAALLR